MTESWKKENVLIFDMDYMMNPFEIPEWKNHLFFLFPSSIKTLILLNSFELYKNDAKMIRTSRLRYLLLFHFSFSLPLQFIPKLVG